MAPTTGIPSMASPTRVPHTGSPRRKPAVPSIGSMIHCLPAAGPVVEDEVPISSPKTSSCGLDCVMVFRMTLSTAWSASVTGVRSGLVEITRSWARKRGSETRSACATRTLARARSSWRVCVVTRLSVVEPRPRDLEPPNYSGPSLSVAMSLWRECALATS